MSDKLAVGKQRGALREEQSVCCGEGTGRTRIWRTMAVDPEKRTALGEPNHRLAAVLKAPELKVVMSRTPASATGLLCGRKCVGGLAGSCEQ